MSRATHWLLRRPFGFTRYGSVELYNVHLMVESVPPKNAFTIMFCNATELSEATANILFKVNKVENQIQAGALSLSFDGVMFPKVLVYWGSRRCRRFYPSDNWIWLIDNADNTSLGSVSLEKKFHLAVQDMTIKGIIDINANTIQEAMKYVHEVVDSLKLLVLEWNIWNDEHQWSWIFNQYRKNGELTILRALKKQMRYALTPQGMKDEYWRRWDCEMTMRGVEISQATHREWRFPAITSDVAVGVKLLLFLMFNPNQMFRIVRMEDVIVIMAVEGEICKEITDWTIPLMLMTFYPFMPFIAPPATISGLTSFPSRHLGFVGIILTNMTIVLIGLFNSKRFLSSAYIVILSSGTTRLFSKVWCDMNCFTWFLPEEGHGPSLRVIKVLIAIPSISNGKEAVLS